MNRKGYSFLFGVATGAACVQYAPAACQRYISSV